MATTKIRDLTAVTTAAVGDKIPTDQSADNVTRYLTITQILDLLATVSQAEAEAGTATTRRAWTAARVKQAITALAPGTTLPVLAKSANYTLTTSDVRKVINASSGTWTLTLPTAATATDGFWFAVRNSGTGVITVDADGSETIDGATTISLVAGQALLVVCDGTGWVTIGADAHIDASTAVHGLTANVNVLGNRNAAAEFVQRGSFNPPSNGTYGYSPVYMGGPSGVTFAVAFSSTPHVAYAGSSDADNPQMGAISAITTTGFSIRMWGVNSGQDLADGRYIALGS